MILEFQCADRVSDSLDGILNGMCKIIHRINAPLIACILVRKVCHTIDNRITHVDVGRGHIYFGPKRLLSVRKDAVLHLLKKAKVLFHRPLTARIVLAGLRQCAAVLAHLLGCEVGHVRLSLADQLHGDLIHLVKIVAGKEQTILVIRSQPCHILLDRLHKFRLFFGRIRIIETKIELAAIFLRKAVVQKNTLGVSDVQIAVGFRREAGLYMIIPSLRQILVDLQLNEVLILAVERINPLGSILCALDVICTHIFLISNRRRPSPRSNTKEPAALYQSFLLLIYAVVRCFLCDLNVMRVVLTQRSIGNLDKLPVLLQLLDRV